MSRVDLNQIRHQLLGLSGNCNYVQTSHTKTISETLFLLFSDTSGETSDKTSDTISDIVLGLMSSGMSNRHLWKHQGNYVPYGKL